MSGCPCSGGNERCPVPSCKFYEPAARHLTADEQTKVHDALMASATIVDPPQPRWRPHTEPVPQDEPERTVFVKRRLPYSTRFDQLPARICRHLDDRDEWVFLDEVDALLGGGEL